MGNFFQKKFHSGHFAAPFLSQDWSSDCRFIKALSREPLFPAGGGGARTTPPPRHKHFFKAPKAVKNSEGPGRGTSTSSLPRPSHAAGGSQTCEPEWRGPRQWRSGRGPTRAPWCLVAEMMCLLLRMAPYIRHMRSFW